MLTLEIHTIIFSFFFFLLSIFWWLFCLKKPLMFYRRDPNIILLSSNIVYWERGQVEASVSCLTLLSQTGGHTEDVTSAHQAGHTGLRHPQRCVDLTSHFLENIRDNLTPILVLIHQAGNIALRDTQYHENMTISYTIFLCSFLCRCHEIILSPINIEYIEKI